MTRILPWLPLAVLIAACLVMNLAARRRRWQSADPPWWWKPWLAPWFALLNWWYRPRPVRLPALLLADEVLPRTPPARAFGRLYRRPAWLPRIIPDIPEQCWCGEGPRYHLPRYVTDALRHPSVAETVDADSMQFPAVTA